MNHWYLWGRAVLENWGWLHTPERASWFTRNKNVKAPRANDSLSCGCMHIFSFVSYDHACSVSSVAGTLQAVPGRYKSMARLFCGLHCILFAFLKGNKFGAGSSLMCSKLKCKTIASRNRHSVITQTIEDYILIVKASNNV